MRDKPRQRRQSPDQAPDLETNIAPDALCDDLRRHDPRPTPPDSMPINDEARKDATPSDYEREIDRLDAAVRAR